VENWKGVGHTNTPRRGVRGDWEKVSPGFSRKRSGWDVGEEKKGGSLVHPIVERLRRVLLLKVLPEK